MEPSDNHALVRTSPKGQKFIGRCVKCGKDGLSMMDTTPCINPSGMSDSEALIGILEDGPISTA